MLDNLSVSLLAFKSSPGLRLSCPGDAEQRGWGVRGDGLLGQAPSWGSEMLLSSSPRPHLPSLLDLSASPLQGCLISSCGGALPEIAASCPTR